MPQPRSSFPKKPFLIFLACILILACNFASPLFAPTPQSTLSLTVTDPSSVLTHSSPSTTSVAQTSLPPSPVPITSTSPSLTPTRPPEIVRFAVIGDFGQGEQAEKDVADLVKSWQPDFVITVGDNNYPSGSPETIDFNIGQFYHEFIFPYSGSFGQGADRIRFFPTLGNHDWDTNRAQAYFDYFVLPGNERYYDFIWGPVHFFALNTDSREPDGVGRSSIQATWLKDKLAASTTPWKLVYGHHPPFSSGLRGPVDWMRWPFQEWGATAYLAGHDHFYERLVINGFPYLINGLGGGPIYDIGFAAEGSVSRYNADYGAILVIANDVHISFQFITRHGDVIDTFEISLDS